MSGITVFVLVGTNEFITVKVFLRLFTIGTWFQNFAFFSHPNGSHFLDWFFNRTIDMSGITVFVLVGTNEFITVKVFLRLFTIGTWFQNITLLSHPNRSHFLDWFFNLAVNVGNGLSSFDNLSRVYLVLFHKGVIVVFKVDCSWMFQLDGFIDRFHTCICGSLDFFTRLVNEFLYDVSFHYRFFNLTIDVGNGLSTFDNLSRVYLVLFDEGIVIILKVDSGWVFQLDDFINRFHTCICGSLDFFTRLVNEFLYDVSFHYRFFNLTIDVGNGLSTFDNLSRVYLVLFDEGIIVILKVNSSWMFQLDSFINWFNSRVSRSLDFFTSLVNEFLYDVSFHYRFLNRFFNLTIDVGNRLSTFDNLSWVYLVLFDEGIVIILKVDGSRVFQLDSFINRFYPCIRRGFDCVASLIHEFLDNVSFHHRFFNFFVDVGNSLGTFDNLRWVNLVLSREGIIVILKVDGSWVFQLDGFINWFHTRIRRSFDFLASFIDELLNHISFHYGLFNFFIEVGNGFTESVWNFRWIHLVLTDELIGFSFKLDGLRMRQAERFTNRFHTCIRLWSQFLVSSFFLKQLAHGTFRIR